MTLAVRRAWTFKVPRLLRHEPGILLENLQASPALMGQDEVYMNVFGSTTADCVIFLMKRCCRR